MANLITLGRLVLLLGLVALTYVAPPLWQLAGAPLLLVIIALDGLDGWVARRRRETSRFGAIFDVAADRIVELVMWIVLADHGLAPVWVALVFVVRGTIVDAIRYGAMLGGETAFSMMRGPLARFLVAGRFLRALYGTAKAVAFAWLLLLLPLPEVAPALWAEWAAVARIVADVLILVCVALCLLRGVPVIAEFVATRRPRPARIGTGTR